MRGALLHVFSDQVFDVFGERVVFQRIGAFNAFRRHFLVDANRVSRNCHAPMLKAAPFGS
jgi:uncharacterized protein YrrD